MPTYTGQKFCNKTRFYLHFFNLSVGLLFSKKKIAFRNFKNSLMLIYTFRFSKQKNEIFVINKLRKYGIFQMQELEKKHIKKFQKNIAEGNRVKRALTELPIVFLVLYQKRLNGHSVFFIFLSLKNFFSVIYP